MVMVWVTIMAEGEAVLFHLGLVTGNAVLKAVDITTSPKMLIVCDAALHDQVLQLLRTPPFLPPWIHLLGLVWALARWQALQVLVHLQGLLVLSALVRAMVNNLVLHLQINTACHLAWVDKPAAILQWVV
jgi:hypothetical protein